MGRRHTAGAVGNQGVGGVQVDNTTLSAANDLDITIDPSGTGIFKIAGDAQLQAQGDLRFADSDSSNYVAFQAPATVASNVTWTLPAADGTANQAIVTNASGVLSFLTVQSTITDTSADATINYPTFITATSGAQTSTGVSSTKLTFQPSTGLLSTTELTVNGTARSLRTELVKTASHTLELADRDKVVAFNGTGSQTVTVPLDSAVAFPVGSVVHINRLNTGSLTLAATGGVTITKTGSFAQYEEIYVRKRAADYWVVVDSPKALTATGGSIGSAAGYRIHSYTSGSSTFVIA
jgi:hypothetical protein